ncbi:hypothetical protein NEF87_002177 [Candidatus Lokiarchaeum ossiferum]|uniref:FHA domain-containing protein n=1 Tax=Candidatus Lokiarchaeum ossiferum TaxID=2951803 RepID=A0ABY6HU66_9ARCH|nr:hypothetical protein NEF87_002177 [Candidatus Lokiarchaeum sp. B-35]
MVVREIYLEIPKIGGKILLPQNQHVFHIGKKDIKKSATLSVDPALFSAISSVRKDPKTGSYVKQQFIISLRGDRYYIEDLNSTNGTYLGNLNLKQTTPQLLKNGDKIIVPVEENGTLIQMDLIFHDTTINTPNGSGSSQVEKLNEEPFKDPTIASTVAPPSRSHHSFTDPTQSPTVAPSEESSSGGVYFDPTQAPTVPPVHDPSMAPAYRRRNAIFMDPEDPSFTSNSFILVKRKMPIPPNAFRPDSGLDLGMVYKLEKSETWHILVAFSLLFIMVYHSYINVMGLTALYYYIQYQYFIGISAIFFEPLPIALIFSLSFIVHETAHLQTGKHFHFQSRFCLTTVGMKTTLRSAIIGIPIALPGAAVSVGVDPDDDKDKMGAIKIAGPASNFILGLVFILISLILPGSLSTLKMIFLQGGSLNCVLGTFNMFPGEFKGFALDGKYIKKWKPKYYFILLVLLLLGLVVSILLSSTGQ